MTTFLTDSLLKNAKAIIIPYIGCPITKLEISKDQLGIKFHHSELAYLERFLEYFVEKHACRELRNDLEMT